MVAVRQVGWSAWQRNARRRGAGPPRSRCVGPVAAVADDEDTLRVLLGLGASAKLTTSRYGGTALLASGASTRLTDREGNTPLALAKARAYAAMVGMLEK